MAEKKTLERFLNEMKEIHNELDFSLVTEYVSNDTKVKAICHCKDYLGREHGEFEITPANLIMGKGCPKCKGKGFTSEDRKMFCEKKYNGLYDYSKADFSTVKKKTTVICKEHGEFEINYDHHFNNGVKCPYCSYPSRDTESFKLEAIKKHNNFYGYDKVDYKASLKKVIITCPIHGDFEQTPNAHLNGQGCPKCAASTLILEETIKRGLESESINFMQNFKPLWLKRKARGNLSLDFYIEDLKLAIECQGKQHFGLGGWSEHFNFDEQFERDRWKMERCEANGIELVYFARQKEVPSEYFGKIFTDFCELMEHIRYLYNKKASA